MEDGLNETQSGTDAISPFLGDAYKQASTAPHPPPFLRVMSVVVITGASRFS
jgi:hypothetical protein